MKNHKKLALVAAVALIPLFTSGCGYVRPQADKIAVHYSGGPLSSKKFVNCVDPSGSNFIGIGDRSYQYPVGQRTASFVKNSADKDFEPIQNVVSKDNVAMTIEGVATFDFTRDCNLVRKFHENIGLKYKAYESDENWNKMLDSYMRQPLVRAITIATAQFNYADLYNNNGDSYTKWVKAIEEQVPALLKAQAGDDYFTNVHMQLQKPDLPQGIVDALNSQQQAVAQNAAQVQQNAKVQTELESIQQLVNVLGVQGFVQYKALQDGKVTVLPVPQGSSIIAQK